MRYLRLTATFLSIAFLACGGGSTKGPADALVDSIDTPSKTDLGPPFIDTVLSKDEVKAGETIKVDCQGHGFDPSDVEIHVWALVKPPAAEMAEGLPVADASVEEPDLGSWTGEMPEGATLENNILRFTVVGSYAVACLAPEAGLEDETAAQVLVDPGNPLNVETTVSTHEITAGEWVDVTCKAWDAYGNEVEEAILPMVTPADGTKISGLSVRLTVAIPHEIACAVQNTSVVDATPEVVTVNANVPKKIYTLVTPEHFQAGESAEVECSVTDYYDNPVSGLPLSVYLPANMSILGKDITTTIAGMYPIKCVPQNIEWKYFQLYGVTVTVTPADPVSLTLKVIPEKEYYGKGASITVTATAVDIYDNLVPDAIVGVPTIEPQVGIQPVEANPTKQFLLKEEGIYLMTFRLLAFPQISADITIKVEGSGPLLTIIYPERGATIAGKPSVTVIGVVNDTVTGIESFTINDQQVTGIKPDGSFTHLINPVQGMNLIYANVKNGAGMEFSTIQSFYFSFVYYIVNALNPEEGMVHNSLRAFVADEFFDDGDHDPAHPDDLATIIESFVGGLNINTLIPNPVAKSGPYKVYIQNVKFGKPTVHINLFDGGMAFAVVIPNLSLDVKLKGKCKFLFIDFCPDFSGDVTVDLIDVKAEIKLWTGSDKKIHAKMENVQVDMHDIDVDIDGILGWLFGWLIDVMVDQFADTIVKAFEQQIGDMVNETVEELFSKFELHETIEIPPLLGNNPTSVSILTRPQNVVVKPDGVRLAMEGSLYSPKGVSHDVLGSISRANCLSMTPPTFDLPYQSEIEFGIFDDLLNEGLYSIWWSGTLNAKITSEDLADVDLSEYGVSDLAVDLDFYLPPILTDCTEDEELQVQVGDLYVDADLLFNGIPLSMGAFVQLAASVKLEAVPNDQGGNDVAITILDLAVFEMEIVSVSENFVGAEDGLEALIKDLLLPPLLEDFIGTQLAAFPIPTIDLATLMPDLPVGVELVFSIEYLDRWEGFTVAAGHLE